MKRLCIALALAPLGMWLLWMLAVPEEALLQALTERALPAHLELKVQELEKTPLGLRARSLSIRHKGQRLLIQEPSLWLEPLGLLALQVKLPFRGRLAGGGLKGTLRASLRGATLKAELKDFRPQELPLLRDWLKGPLTARAELHLPSLRGPATLGAEDILIKGLPIGPVKAKLRGRFLLEGPEELLIEALSIDAPEFFARLRGSIKGGRYELTLEVMPEEPTGPLAMLLGAHRVSPGYHVLKFRGRLAEASFPARPSLLR